MKQLCLILLCLLTPAFLTAKPINLAFINPGHNNHNTTGPFWFEVSMMMNDAATDMGVELTTYYANRNHILMKSQVTKALKTKPDMLILADEKGVLASRLEELAPISTPIFFLLNRPSTEKIAQLVAKGVNIVGSLVPNNYQAGHLLAKQLYQQTEQQGVRFFALEGDYTTTASIERSKGLAQFVKQKNAQVVSTSVANWSRNQGYQQTLAYFSHQLNADLIWSANDAMAFGAIDALKQLGLRDKVKVGAVNWPTSTYKEQLDVSIGGHMTLGAYAIVNIADYLHAPNTYKVGHQSVAIFTPLSAPIKQLVKQLHKQQLNINFAKFSAQNSEQVPFTINNLLKEITATN